MLKLLSTACSYDVKEKGDEHGIKTTCTSTAEHSRRYMYSNAKIYPNAPSLESSVEGLLSCSASQCAV